MYNEIVYILNAVCVTFSYVCEPSITYILKVKEKKMFLLIQF